MTNPLKSSITRCPHDFFTGEVFTWGDNDEGQLGDGTTNAVQRPRLVAALQGKKINRVACGSAHTLAWSTLKPTVAAKLPAKVSGEECRNKMLIILLTSLSGPSRVRSVERNESYPSAQ